MRALNVELEKTSVQMESRPASSPDDLQNDSQTLVPSDLTDIHISTANAALKQKVRPPASAALLVIFLLNFANITLL